MSRLEKLKQKAKGLEVKDPKGAIDAWLEAVKAQEGQAEPDPDLSIFNRVGDLYLKIKDAATAADYYDRAVDKYAEHGLHNNAIAMCNKVLRNAPGRQDARAPPPPTPSPLPPPSALGAPASGTRASTQVHDRRHGRVGDGGSGHVARNRAHQPGRRARLRGDRRRTRWVRDDDRRVRRPGGSDGRRRRAPGA